MRGKGQTCGCFELGKAIPVRSGGLGECASLCFCLVLCNRLIIGSLWFMCISILFFLLMFEGG